MSKTVEYPMRKSRESECVMRFRKAWDNRGKTFDRYSVTFEAYNEHTGQWDIFSEGWNVSAPVGDKSCNRIYCLGMSDHPFHPQGFGQSSTCVEGKHLGKRVTFSQLPEEVQRCILQYLES